MQLKPTFFMNIDRLLNIHQSYSLTTIKAINQQILIAQYAQCEQISKLQDEIAASNAVLKQILKNQLEDLRHREKQRYYKSLAYNINEAVDIISAESSSLAKICLGVAFRDVLLLNVQEAKDNLDDISDKEYCKSVENKMQDILNAAEKSGDNISFRLLESQKEYSELKNRAEHKKKELNECASKVSDIPKQEKNIKRGCLMKFLLGNALFWLLMIVVSLDDKEVVVVFSVLFLLSLIPWAIMIYNDWKSRSNHEEYVRNWKSIHNDALVCIKQEYDDLQQQLQFSEYVQIMRQMTSESPYWENKAKKIYSFIPKVSVK